MPAGFPVCKTEPSRRQITKARKADACLCARSALVVQWTWLTGERKSCLPHARSRELEPVGSQGLERATAKYRAAVVREKSPERDEFLDVCLVLTQTSASRSCKEILSYIVSFGSKRSIWKVLPRSVALVTHNNCPNLNDLNTLSGLELIQNSCKGDMRYDSGCGKSFFFWVLALWLLSNDPTKRSAPILPPIFITRFATRNAKCQSAPESSRRPAKMGLDGKSMPKRSGINRFGSLRANRGSSICRHGARSMRRHLRTI